MHKSLIIFFDEVDTLLGDTLISLLCQIRAGYAQHPEAFPQSDMQGQPWLVNALA